MQEYITRLLVMVIVVSVAMAHGPPPEKFYHLERLETVGSPHISPEIVKEFKDFEHLIPTAIVDEIVAKHYLIDGNFRTAFNYLRSAQFAQLQKQLLNIPEIIEVLQFLHLLSANATTRHMGTSAATTIRQPAIEASLDDYGGQQDVDDAADDDINAANQMTTNTGSVIFNRNSIVNENVPGTFNSKKLHRRPQFQAANRHGENYVVNDDNAIANASNEEEPLVRFVLLEDQGADEGQHQQHHRHHHQHHHHHDCHRQHQHHHPHYHQHYSSSLQHQHSLGTFTTFVAEILQHLPHSAFQSMIKEKCQKNVKFAEFYKALKSPEFKPLVDEVMTTNNIVQVVHTLGSHDVDVKALEPIAFQVISWGPDV